jgi:hypothetical protein
MELRLCRKSFKSAAMLIIYITDGIKSVRIGDVVINVGTPNSPELVPEYDDPMFEDSQEVLRHLRWYIRINLY